MAVVKTVWKKLFGRGAKKAAAAEPEAVLKTEETAEVTAEPAEAMPRTMECVLRLPDGLLERLMRKPFRKRHPVLFWAAIVIVALLALNGLYFLFAGDDGDEEELLAGEPSLALVSVEGPIMDITSDLRWIARLRNDESIVGVLVRVDSPGGGVAASEELYQALRALGQVKPVVISMGSTAASGGLMVSMAGERVFASGTTVTGSIGVRMDIPQVGQLLDKVGVGQQTLTIGEWKDAGSLTRPLSDRERAYFTELMRDMYEQFVDIIAEGRKMDRQETEKLATGRVFSGREALANGLVDELGGQDAAHAWLCEKTGVSVTRRLVRRPVKESWLYDRLSSFFGHCFSAVAGQMDRKSRPAFLFQL